MAPFSVIVFGVVVWTIAVSGTPVSFENGLVWTGPQGSNKTRRTHGSVSIRSLIRIFLRKSRLFLIGVPPPPREILDLATLAVNEKNFVNLTESLP